jgi:hypothetical protein
MSKRDLLRKLRSVRSTERGIVPDQAWVLRTRSRLMEQTRHAEALSPLPASLRFREAARTFVPAEVLRWMRTPALAALSILVAVLGGSLAGVNASDRSVPGDFLYPIKIAGEQTRLAFTQDKADRVRLKAEFVDRRVEEIKTIANAPDKKHPDRLRDAAIGLKRDLDTVKLQLKEVEQESSAQVTAELAKLVDEKIDQVSKELKQVNTESSQEAKPAVAEAAAQAVQTSVAAVAVLIDARTQPDAKDVISDEDVAKVLQEKLLDLHASINNAIMRLQLANATDTSSMTVATATLQLASASATLGEVKALISEQKLNEATQKLADAAKVTAQAVAAAELFLLDSAIGSVSETGTVPSGSASSSGDLVTPTSTSTSSPSPETSTSTPPS